MLDRETFKERLLVITDYFDMVDRVHVALNGAFEIFEVNELCALVDGYTDALKRDMNDDIEYSSIDWWLEEYIMSDDKDNFKPTVTIDDKDVIINTPDKLYDYLKEYATYE